MCRDAMGFHFRWKAVTRMDDVVPRYAPEHMVAAIRANTTVSHTQPRPPQFTDSVGGCLGWAQTQPPLVGLGECVRVPFPRLNVINITMQSGCNVTGLSPLFTGRGVVRHMRMYSTYIRHVQRVRARRSSISGGDVEK